MVKGRVSDRIKFYEGEGRLTKEQIRGRADRVEEGGACLILNNVHVGNPKAKPLAELPRPVSSITDDCIEVRRHEALGFVYMRHCMTTALSWGTALRLTFVWLWCVVGCRAARRSSPRTLAEQASCTITATQRRFKLGS